MFDKIMIIDKGGYQIFYGNPSEAIVYFKTQASYANANEDQCITCGNVDSDQLLQIIEAKVINENGKLTHIRKVSPKEWAQKFFDCSKNRSQKTFDGNQILPQNFYAIPGLFKQTKIYFIRDILSKLANRQYVLISLLGAPLLAFLLAYFTKYTIDGEYVFNNNENLPSYLFMCVITSLFLGLIISAEEIVKDRKILKRETFLNLSWFSYLNSKITIMFLISAIQTLSFILIGNYILEIKGMTLPYWFVLFTTSCFANILGLNISSAFSSVITIYILIPFILIPQLLFSGVIVTFDKLHKNSMSSHEYVPAIGDLMSTRWSYEALAVEQFRNNKYEKNFFHYDMQISQDDWYSSFLINELITELKVAYRYKDDLKFQEMVNANLVRLNYHLEELRIAAGFGTKIILKTETLDSLTSKNTELYLDNLKHFFIKNIKRNISLKDSVSLSLKGKIEMEGLQSLEDDYHNDKLSELLLDMYRLDKSVKTNTRIIRKLEPAYMKPASKFGNAHFYAPVKQIGNLQIDTYWFNLMVLWFVILLLYITLYYNLLQKLINLLGKPGIRNYLKKETI
jgi:hypothetical protein